MGHEYTKSNYKFAVAREKERHQEGGEEEERLKGGQDGNDKSLLEKLEAKLRSVTENDDQRNYFFSFLYSSVFCVTIPSIQIHCC